MVSGSAGRLTRPIHQSPEDSFEFLSLHGAGEGRDTDLLCQAEKAGVEWDNGVLKCWT